MIAAAPQLDRARLLARIARRYTTVCQTIAAGPLQFDFHRIADPDAVLNRLADLERRHPAVVGPVHLPYWAQVWESSTALADCLRGLHPVGPPVRDGESILDLGCGMGLCGTVAAALGAGRVVMADCEPDALLLARLNSLPFGNRVRVRRLDWNVDRIPDRFDTIVGADILYDRPQWEGLHTFWMEQIKIGGKILLAEPGRSRADEFPQFAADHGWVVHQQTTQLVDSARRIRLIRLERG